MKALSVFILGLILAVLPVAGSASESICYGTPKKGKLKNGVQLPRVGNNYQVFSDLGYSLGRTYVHSRVAEIIQASYSQLETALPNTIFVYGDSGWKSGGRFKPHKTHQNGLSVDFMVPILDPSGKSIPLPSGPQ